MHYNYEIFVKHKNPVNFAVTLMTDKKERNSHRGSLKIVKWNIVMVHGMSIAIRISHKTSIQM